MGISRGAVCPVDDNSVFVIRQHRKERTPSIPSYRSNNLSRQTSVKSFQSKVSRLTLDEDLEALRSANMVFVRQVVEKAEEFAGSPNKFVVVDSSGEMMFCAIETTDVVTKSPPAEDQPFKFAFLNTQGEEVFDVDGHPGVKGIGAFVTVKRENAVLGNVAQINKISSCWHKLPPSYLVEAADGRTIQKIRRHETWKTKIFRFLSTNDFNVFSPDGSICKAKISRQKDAICLEDYSEADTYALSFHTTDMDGKVKALLVSAVLMLDLQFFGTQGKVIANRKSVINRTLVCLITLFAFCAAVGFVVWYAFNFKAEKIMRFPGQIPT